MNILIEIDSLLNCLSVENIEEMESIIDSSSPSLVLYKIRNLMESPHDEVYLNKALVERTISCGEIKIHFDYSNNCYLEDNSISQDFDQPTLW